MGYSVSLHAWQLLKVHYVQLRTAHHMISYSVMVSETASQKREMGVVVIFNYFTHASKAAAPAPTHIHDTCTDKK